MERMEEIQRKLQAQPLWRSHIPFGLQMGFPRLSLKREVLCLSFSIHKMEADENKLVVYSPRYAITWVYPFEKIVEYKDYLYDDEPDEGTSVFTEIRFGSQDIELYNGLYSECEKAIDTWILTNDKEPVVGYQRLFDKTSMMLGISHRDNRSI